MWPKYLNTEFCYHKKNKWVPNWLAGKNTKKIKKHITSNVFWLSQTPFFFFLRHCTKIGNRINWYRLIIICRVGSLITGSFCPCPLKFFVNPVHLLLLTSTYIKGLWLVTLQIGPLRSLQHCSGSPPHWLNINDLREATGAHMSGNVAARLDNLFMMRGSCVEISPGASTQSNTSQAANQPCQSVKNNAKIKAPYRSGSVTSSASLNRAEQGRPPVLPLPNQEVQKDKPPEGLIASGWRRSKQGSKWGQAASASRRPADRTISGFSAFRLICGDSRSWDFASWQQLLLRREGTRETCSLFPENAQVKFWWNGHCSCIDLVCYGNVFFYGKAPQLFFVWRLKHTLLWKLSIRQSSTSQNCVFLYLLCLNGIGFFAIQLNFFQFGTSKIHTKLVGWKLE